MTVDLSIPPATIGVKMPDMDRRLARLSSTTWLLCVVSASALLGAAGCKKGDSTTAPAGAGSGLPVLPAGSQRVLATEAGFEPAQVSLKKGDKLVFRRTSEATCATEVVFPELHIQKPLPLNTDVVIELPASASGEVGFQCGMGMYKSKLVVSPS